MAAMHEERVSRMAYSRGLRLTRVTEVRRDRRYQLIEHETMTPVFPGRPDDGATLDELEAWLDPSWD